ncbi:RidA family protein, partial [Aspergillus homomorphus CBS 101889]
TVKAIAPPSIHSPQGKYSHVLLIEGPHKTIEIAGQVGMKPDGTIPATYDEQVQQAFQNLKACLDSVGSSTQPIITRLRYYIVDYNPEKFGPLREARELIFEGYSHPFPPSVLVPVPALGDPAFLVEVEASAV